MSFLWVTKSMSDMSWALPKDSKEKEGFVERLNVYITRASVGDDIVRQMPAVDDDGVGYAETEEGIELQEQESRGDCGKAKN